MLSGCVSGENGALAIAELGEPGTKTVVAKGVDEAGQAVELRAAVPAAKPGGVAVAATEAEEATAVTALVPPSRPGAGGTISGSAAIDRMIEEAAAANGVPRELAFAVVRVESHYNPRAKGAGVYGLSQIMPATARSLGFSGPAEALFDPATNLRYGMKYLKGAWEKGGRDVCQASMKYKGGHRATTMTKSAAAYCANVKRHMAAITGRPAVAAETQVAAVDVPTSKAGETPAKAAPVVVAAASAEPKASPAAAALAPAPAATSGAMKSVEASSTVGAVVAASKPAVPQPSEASAAVKVAEVKGGRAVHQAPAAADPDPSRFGE